MLVVGVLWFSRRVAGYSHIRHTISELGETGSPWSAFVSWACFAPVGVGLLLLSLVLVASSISSPLAEPLTLLSAAVGIGYLGGSLFPCDPGSPVSGSWRQQFHNLVGGVEYIGGASALFVASQSLAAIPSSTTLQQVLACSAIIVAVVAVLLSISLTFPLRGAVQRVGEVTLFANILFLAGLVSASG
jgi:hypothetical protein